MHPEEIEISRLRKKTSFFLGGGAAYHRYKFFDDQRNYEIRSKDKNNTQSINDMRTRNVYPNIYIAIRILVFVLGFLIQGQHITKDTSPRFFFQPTKRTCALKKGQISFIAYPHITGRREVIVMIHRAGKAVDNSGGGRREAQ